ncbi:MAG TPA: cytochrome C oxidase subunit IV family protein [Opitutaceae bacterium]|jgi:caa(3)-type oxidase subunit IV|nr:cytochrome C oxidase subunit IV family protein [Opitutaceae bacterium]
MKRLLQANRDLALVLAALLALLAASAATVLLPLAPWKTACSLGIAAAKAALVGALFMRLREHGGLTRVFAAAGLCWLAILAVLAAADYLTR